MKGRDDAALLLSAGAHPVPIERSRTLSYPRLKLDATIERTENI